MRKTQDISAGKGYDPVDAKKLRTTFKRLFGFSLGQLIKTPNGTGRYQNVSVPRDGGERRVKVVLAKDSDEGDATILKRDFPYKNQDVQIDYELLTYQGNYQPQSTSRWY